MFSCSKNAQITVVEKPQLKILKKRFETLQINNFYLGHSECACALLRSAHDFPDLVSKQNTEGTTALHMAAGKGILEQNGG